MPSPDQIKAALDRAANTIVLKPSVGQRVYAVAAVVEDGLACRVEEKEHSLLVDLPPSMGGDGGGPSPSMLMRAALSSCVAIGIKMWAARRGVAIDRIAVRLETDVDARGQFGVADDVSPGFEDIRLEIDIRSPVDPELIRDIIRTSLRYSPLMDAVREPQEISTHIRIQNTGAP